MTSQGTSQIKTSVGHNIRRIRKARNLYQRELAAMVGTEGFAVSRWEMGRVLPGPEYLARIAAALECEIADFYLEPEREAA